MSRPALQLNDERVITLIDSHRQKICESTDWMLMWLMVLQWIGGVVTALTLTPKTWIGETSQLHVHVWAAVILGAVISSLPIALVLRRPGEPITRHTMAIAQMLWSVLLIHIAGGRIETHFHVFGSLAFLACYRDHRVLLTATIVIAVDHFVRGLWWPQSVFGVVLESPWRWVEHAAWVLFEDCFLLIAMSRSMAETKELCFRQAELEKTNASIEQEVADRTRELNASKDFFRVILDSIDANICILDSTGLIVETNRNWMDFAEQVDGEGDYATTGKGANYLDACRGAAGSCRGGALRVADAVERIIAGDLENYVDEYPCHSESRKAWYQVRITPLEGGDSALRMVVVAHVDITDRVLADLELVEKTREAEKMALVAKYTDNAVVITDDRCRIEWVNEGFTRVTGYELEEVVGKTPGSFLQGPETDPVAVDVMRKALQRKEGFDVELINYSKTGEPYWVAIEARPIRGADGEVTKFIALESDITGQKRAAEEKESLQQELLISSHKAGMAELATDILHNVGNVLNSINVSVKLVSQQLRNGSLGTVRRASDLVQEHRDDLGAFVTEDNRGKLLPDFLDQLAGKLETEKDAMEGELESLAKNVEHVKEIVAVQQDVAKATGLREEVDLAVLVEDALKAVDGSIVKHGINLRRQFEDCPPVLTDKHKVLQVLVNLISNARHAVRSMEPDARDITIRVYSNASSCFVDVIDAGVGISQDIQQRIFEHGFTTKKDGHGFGLHGSANAAHVIGGHLHVESDGPGCGATFSLEIPLESASAVECPMTSEQMVGS